MQRQNETTQKQGLATLEKIYHENASKLPDWADAIEIKKLKDTKLRIDKVGIAKQKKMSYQSSPKKKQ